MIMVMVPGVKGRGMSAFELIENMALMIRHISPRAVLLEVGDVAEGPGGKYQPAVWEIGGTQVQAVVVYVDSSRPIAVGAVWSDVQMASEAARRFAARAAECELFDDLI